VSTENNEVIDDDVQTQDSHLGLSDEDFLKLPPPELVAPVVEPTTSTTEPVLEDTTQEAGGEGATDETGSKPVEDGATDAVMTDEQKAAAGWVRDAQGRFVSKEKATDTTTEKVDPAAKVEDGETKPATTTTEQPAVNFEAEYKRLLAPFKANGKDLAVGNVDEAIALMQMGANYNKKMAALKPNLRLMKMLDNAGLMSEDQISYLIDLGKKNPAAINKLVKDSGLDPMDLDAEKAGTYKPTTRTVDDREIELDTVLDELKDSSTYTRTLDVVSNKWDAASKQTIAGNPELLKVIDGHIASGIYDLISTEVERQRVFGRLKGIPDIEAYRTVGDDMNAKGGFNHLFQKEQPAKTAPASPVIVTPPAKPVDEKLNDKRRAAGSTKPAATSAAPAKDFNPLAMSDEDFGKLVYTKYL
jgi:hypothetical protein